MKKTTVTCVLDNKGQPLMPTIRQNKVAWLLKNKKAKVVNMIPFTIQLLESSQHYKQPTIIGIDDGDKKVGIGIMTEGKNNPKGLLLGTLKLRTRISKLLKARYNYRRTRRSRIRRRPARFDNRIKSKCKQCGQNAAHVLQKKTLKQSKSKTEKAKIRLQEKLIIKTRKGSYKIGYCRKCSQNLVNQKQRAYISYQKQKQKARTIGQKLAPSTLVPGLGPFIKNKDHNLCLDYHAEYKQSIGWLPPSSISRAEEIIRLVKYLQKYFPLSSNVYELNYFDFPEQYNSNITNFEYQRGPRSFFKGMNLHGAVLQRDKNTCAICRDTKSVKEIHHIIKSGPDRLDNLITLCHQTKSKNKCHSKLHKGIFQIRKKQGDKTKLEIIDKNGTVKKCIDKPKSYGGDFQQRRTYIMNELNKLLPLQAGFGYWVKHKRFALNLPPKNEDKPKTIDHAFDAAALAINKGFDRKDEKYITTRPLKSIPLIFFEINPKVRHKRQKFYANYIKVRKDTRNALLKNQRPNNFYIAKTKNNKNGRPIKQRGSGGYIKWINSNIAYKIIIKRKKGIEHMHILKKIHNPGLVGFKVGDLVRTKEGKGHIQSIKNTKGIPSYFAVCLLKNNKVIRCFPSFITKIASARAFSFIQKNLII